ncbi:MAG TPA: GNAT family N-acetyltransferase [Thermoplasmatales archaeon]|nr:GNAT family N-acetyltransferase [Thermoplasmatales archaeon]
MCSKDFEIKIIDNWSEDELVELYKAGGWWEDSYDKLKLKDLIKDSFVFMVVIEKKSGRAIGMGRLLSDGVSDAYIQDFVVLPKYRGRGIGKQLVKKLVEYCHSKGIHWIGLIAEPNQDGFYSKIGFKHMKNYVPMKYEE